VVVQFVSRWAGRTELPIWRLLRWLGLARSKFDRWSRRLGTPNQHNSRIPRDFWLEDWEKTAIIAFHDLYPLEGYRRLAYMMLDACLGTGFQWNFSARFCERIPRPTRIKNFHEQREASLGCRGRQ
jgi:hypothetical protein